MSRDTSTDGITLSCVLAYVPILNLLSGWGVRTEPPDTPAVYGGLLLPFPQEPFPAAYVYLASQRHINPEVTGYRYDINTITVRIVGGSATPNYKFNPEHAALSMITAVKNELSYRPYLQDPTQNNKQFQYIMPDQKLTVKDSGRVQTWDYGTQGKYIGYEIPTTVGLNIHVGRLS